MTRARTSALALIAVTCVVVGAARPGAAADLARIDQALRNNPSRVPVERMVPYSSVESIGGVQSVADVAGYIDTLEMTASNEKGPGDDLEVGEKLYQEHCARCHGAGGEGDEEDFVPRIQAQHYSYLVRQFEFIRDGKRRNANAEMAAQIGDFSEREMRAVLDCVSRLEPPEALRAPPGWHDPDFEISETPWHGRR